jgi:Flp pilus assembly protein TadD
MSKKKRRPQPQSAPATSRHLIEGLQAADTLMRRRRWIEARDLLEPLQVRYPGRVDVLTLLLGVYYELRDTDRYQIGCERLLKLTPNDPEVMLALGSAYMSNVRPVLSLRTYRQFLERWPDHERADEIRQLLVKMAPTVEKLLADVGLQGDDQLDLAVLHEEGQVLMQQGKYAEARQTQRKLLQRRPDFVPALNNLSLICMIEGQLDQAIATARQVLDRVPDNFHALANLTHYCCLSGRVEEAKQWAERLKAVESEAVDVWVKQAEALSYLGDDQGVLDAFHGAERTGHLEPGLADALLCHLAAVAAMRLGDEKLAHRYWNQALKLEPGHALTRANLADLRRPVGERHAPWAFGFQNWVLPTVLQDLASQFTPAHLKAKQDVVTPILRRYLRDHPELAGVVPLLLDRGDPEGREFAMRLAVMGVTPELLAALRDFALSQRGPDAMRAEAAQAASAAGLLPSGPIRIWLRGEWGEMMALGFDIHDEPMYRHPPQVEQWGAEAILAMRERKTERAEQLLQQALEIEPHAPDLLNNLAVAYELQGRREEAQALLRQIHERDPDYLFARASLARLCLSRGEIDQAEALLQPLLTRRRFHVDEFGKFCSAQIELLVAQGNDQAARSWLDMWANVDADNPELGDWRRRLRHPARLR